MKRKITLIITLSLGVFGCFMVINAMTKDSQAIRMRELLLLKRVAKS